MKNLTTTHLSFPFAKNAEITIKRKKRITKIEAELATSEIEIFQSACYRTSKDLQKPLVLFFENSTIQSFTLQNYQTPIEQILVEVDTKQCSGCLLAKTSASSRKSYPRVYGPTMCNSCKPRVCRKKQNLFRRYNHNH